MFMTRVIAGRAGILFLGLLSFWTSPASGAADANVGREAVQRALEGKAYWENKCDTVVLERIAGGIDVDGDRNDDVLRGFSADDTIHGHGGNDVVIAGGGDDRLFGDLGDDSLEGGDGDDSLVGGRGNDRLAGGAGIDTYVFGAGDDICAGDMDDVVEARGGNDKIDLGNGTNEDGGEGFAQNGSDAGRDTLIDSWDDWRLDDAGNQDHWRLAA